MFSQGINEMQSIANSMGSYGIQDDINNQSIKHLENYFTTYKAWHKSQSKRSGRGGVPTVGVPTVSFVEGLEGRLKRLRRIVTDATGSGKKSIEILTESAAFVREINGCRFTSCKSAKDRTGMSVTLEQTRILTDHHRLDDEVSE